MRVSLGLSMKVLLGFLIAVALPTIASAHGWGGGGWGGGGWGGGGGGGWGSPAPAPDLATGLPAALAVIGAFAATRFKRKG